MNVSVFAIRTPPEPGHISKEGRTKGFGKSDYRHSVAWNSLDDRFNQNFFASLIEEIGSQTFHLVNNSFLKPLQTLDFRASPLIRDPQISPGLSQIGILVIEDMFLLYTKSTLLPNIMPDLDKLIFSPEAVVNKLKIVTI